MFRPHPQPKQSVWVNMVVLDFGKTLLVIATHFRSLLNTLICVKWYSLSQGLKLKINGKLFVGRNSLSKMVLYETLEI